MPRIDSFNINDTLVDDIREVRASMGNQLDATVTLPKGIGKTVKPIHQPSMEEWFAHVKSSLRQRDLFGNLIYNPYLYQNE